MEDEMFDTQCKAVATCIKRLSLTLLEAGSDTSVSKVVAEVHKLIQSFRLLGNHYVSELLKKCIELETKSQEVKELSRKLEQGESHTLQKPELILVVDAKRDLEGTVLGGCVKNVEEFSVREHELPGSTIEIFETLNGKSEELDKSLKCLARLDESREEMREVHETVGKLAMCNEFLLRDCGGAPNAAFGVGVGERSRVISGRFLQRFNEFGAIKQSCNKRRREVVDRASFSNERKKSSNSNSCPTTKKPTKREDLDLRLSHESNQGTVQEIVAREQNMVETLCKALEHYQHEFWKTCLVQMPTTMLR